MVEFMILRYIREVGVCNLEWYIVVLVRVVVVKLIEKF